VQRDLRIKESPTYFVIYIILCDLKSSISCESKSTLKNRSATAFAVTKVRSVRHKAYKEFKEKEEEKEEEEEEEEDEGEVSKIHERNAREEYERQRRRKSVYWRKKTASPLDDSSSSPFLALPGKAGEIMPPSWMLVNIPCRKRASSRARDPALGGEVSCCYY